MSKVRKSDGCWLWAGGRTEAGYGRFSVGGASRSAHRMVYQVLRGPVDPSLDLDHLCRNPRCVNPEHLEPVTHRENLLRGDTVSGRQAAKDTCSQGHPFSPENTHIRPGGGRRCRACDNERGKRRWAVAAAEGRTKDGKILPIRQPLVVVAERPAQA